MIGEHIEALAFGGCKVKTHFHFPREDMVCGEEEVVVVVVTSQSRMRTVVRLYEEPLRERRNHLKKTVEPLAESNSVESYTATQRSNT